MKTLFTMAFYLGLAVLPSRLKIAIYNKFFGCEIDKTAHIGFSYIRVRKIKMGPHSYIGHLNILKNLELLEMDHHATMGNLNRASALPFGSAKHFQEVMERFPSLSVGAHTAIVRGHFFDCNSAIKFGHHSLLAGHGSAFFTHGVNVERNRQETAPVTIGNYCMIAACCVITKGASLPDYSVLGANSTLHKAFEQTHTLYSGVPAKAVRALDPASVFFHRESGRVD